MTRKAMIGMLILFFCITLIGCTRNDDQENPINEVYDINNITSPSEGYLFIDNKVYGLYPLDKQSTVKELKDIKSEIGKIKRVVNKIEYDGDVVFKSTDPKLKIETGDSIYSLEKFPGKEVLIIRTLNGDIMTNIERVIND